MCAVILLQFPHTRVWVYNLMWHSFGRGSALSEIDEKSEASTDNPFLKENY